MIKNFVTFGSSWPCGAELNDTTKAFGHLISKMLDTETYKNYAIENTSNDRMILQLQKYIKDHGVVKDHLALFCITSANRRLLLDVNSAIKEIRVPLNWKTELDPVVSNWYRYFHNDESDNFNLYKVLLSLQKICEQHNIQDYYVSDSTNIDFEMLGIDRKKIFPITCIEMFGGKNTIEFHDFDKNPYIYPNMSHPNEQGHALIAKNIYQWITSVQSKI
jgi:hypothetical protein